MVVPMISLTACTPGHFGADCKQICHCDSGNNCESDTGICTSGSCTTGWEGENCQGNHNI